MKLPLFVQAAADPTLIPGIYDACDQWCMYCPSTHWCLAYRCGPEIRSGKGNVHRSLADRLFEGITFLKQLSEAEGRPTPEIDAMLSDDPRRRAQLVINDDPIERMRRRYGRLSKVALIGMDRSLDALAAMAVEDNDPRLESMRAQLRRLRREVDARFPSARAFVRPGLDPSP